MLRNKTEAMSCTSLVLYADGSSVSTPEEQSMTTELPQRHSTVACQRSSSSGDEQLPSERQSTSNPPVG